MKVNLQNQMLKHSTPQDLNINQALNNQLLDSNLVQNDFKSILKSTNIAASQSMFENLIEKLSKQEKIIINNPNMANIHAYKSIVMNMLDLASKNFKNSELELYSNEGYKKFVNLSEVINNELQSLISDFLENNRLSMSAIDTFANIKGLLLDICI